MFLFGDFKPFRDYSVFQKSYRRNSINLIFNSRFYSMKSENSKVANVYKCRLAWKCNGRARIRKVKVTGRECTHKDRLYVSETQKYFDNFGLIK